jgi:hypothetical protein
MEKIALDLSLVLAPYFQTLHIITILFPNAPFPKWSIFFGFEALGEGLQMFFQFQKPSNNV